MENKIQITNKMKLLYTLLSLLIISVFLSFVWVNKGRKKLTQEEYINQIENSEILNLEKKIDDIKYQCFLMPPNYNAIKQLKSDLDTNIINNAIKNSEGFVFFKFTIKSTNSDNTIMDPSKIDSKEYNKRIQYFNAFAQNNFKLLADQDTLNCVQYLFENPYNLTSDVKILGAFKLKQKYESTDLQIIYNDQLFNQGLIKFYYQKKQLQKTPQLIIK